MSTAGIEREHGSGTPQAAMLSPFELPSCISPKIPSLAAGAGYFELCGAALRTLSPDSALHTRAAVTGAAIPAPLLLPPMQQPASAVIECSVALASGGVEVASLVAGSSSRPVHVSAAAAVVPAPQQAGAQAGSGRAGTLSLLVAGAAAAQGPSAAAAALSALQSSTGTSGFWFDPAAFDSFLQLGQVFKAAGSTEVFVPAGMGALQVASPTGADASSWAAAVPVPAAEGTVSTDFRLGAAASQEQLCSIAQLAAKSMGKAQAGSGAGQKAALAEQTECLYEVAWQAAEAATSLEPVVHDDPANRAFWRLGAAEQSEPAVAAASAIAAVQRLLRDSSAASAAGHAIQLQTVGTALLPHPESASSGCAGTKVAAASSLAGLIKTLGQEVPQLAWSSQDADGQAPVATRTGSAALVRLPAGAQPDSDAFGGAARGGARLAPLLLKAAAVEQLGPHRLFPMPRGNLGSLAAQSVDVSRKLAADEVLVAVRAVGINFRWAAGAEAGDWASQHPVCILALLKPLPSRIACTFCSSNPRRDVLNVLGMYPGDPGPPGGDCAGVVLRGSVLHNGGVVAGPGDAVFGLAAGSLGSHVVASRHTMVPMPTGVRQDDFPLHVLTRPAPAALSASNHTCFILSCLIALAHHVLPSLSVPAALRRQPPCRPSL